ncbi:hypothetical protein EYF80_007896 [Liparis tanakae]|uniref:Uncharacterized protein n=1 Tax=Liparis tanakae TaxID=230148 RepID=A0A4Z2IVI9_9TELE|nr:hypothetical protein EYF80_007896 [Liparis tanakae]
MQGFRPTHGYSAADASQAWSRFRCRVKGRGSDPGASALLYLRRCVITGPGDVSSPPSGLCSSEVRSHGERERPDGAGRESSVVSVRLSGVSAYLFTATRCAQHAACTRPPDWHFAGGRVGAGSQPTSHKLTWAEKQVCCHHGDCLDICITTGTPVFSI